MNTIKQPIEEIPVAADHKKDAVTEPVKLTRKATRMFESMNIFSFMEKETIIRMMPFVFFMTLLALVYISNSYYAEKTIREIDATGKEIKELRSEFISGQSELMMKSKQTEVLNAVAQMGLKQSLEPPKKIMIKSIQKRDN